MMIEVLKSKIHCARVTEANLNYMGVFKTLTRNHCLFWANKNTNNV